MLISLFAAVLAFTGDESPAPIEPAEAAAIQAVAAYYPPAAKAAGIEGRAILRCTYTTHAAMKDCTLLAEEPVGQGFGQAALALARASVGNSAITLDPKQMVETELLFRFRLNPISITPNPLLPAHVLRNPDWIRRPSSAEIADAAKGVTKHMDGVAVIDCVVAVSQALEDCKVVVEDPPGHGFGAAALKVSSYMRMRPQLRDGTPVGGAHVKIPLRFGPAS